MAQPSGILMGKSSNVSQRVSLAEAAQGPGVVAAILVGLSLSIGWGIRGNFGHEYGAMIPGVLASLAVVLLSGRDDWHRRGLFFAFFGALGWSFGGSISYMQVVAYTHSGHSSSVLYGFACLFVIGFLWAAMGGAGAALPAFLSRERLTEFFAPLTAVFVAWTLEDILTAGWFPIDSAYRQESPLYWYDTDWLAALLAIVAVLVLALARRRWDPASSLIMHMAIGWWAGFLVLVILLGWRMTPPRGDNWAGCVGMVLGMWLYFMRRGLSGVTLASLVCGFIGGFGFAFAQMLKLVEISSGRQTNWHSILEQTYGFINGIGLACALFWVARRAPRLDEKPPVRVWVEPYAAGFVLIILTYLNLSKNPEEWIKLKAMPPVLYGLSANAWFNLAYVGFSTVFVLLWLKHRRQPLAILSTTWLARDQMLYLVFLWVMVLGNFERALPSFAPQRLVTEGVIFLNATVCTAGIFLSAPTAERVAPVALHDWSAWLRRAVVAGSIATILTVVAEWAVVRGIYGDKQAGYAAKHIRFGPDATATKEKPKGGLPHP
jgi:hypothetical protein